MEIRGRTNGTEARSHEPGSAAQRVADLVEQIEAFRDPQARELMEECLQAVMELYGAGMERIMAIASQPPGSERSVRDALVQDDIVRGLLFIHGLHPIPLEIRLQSALVEVRPYMESHGGNVELVGLTDGVATLRLAGHCKSCPSSAITLDLAIRQAIEEACPDLLRLEVEGFASAKEPQFGGSQGAPRWHVIGQDDIFGASDNLTALQINGDSVLLCKLADLRYAYRNICPICNSSLHHGSLAGEILRCPEGHRFNIRRAGASPDQSDLHLDPLPLVTTDGYLRVALLASEPDLANTCV